MPASAATRCRLRQEPDAITFRYYARCLRHSGDIAAVIAAARFITLITTMSIYLRR